MRTNGFFKISSAMMLAWSMALCAGGTGDFSVSGKVITAGGQAIANATVTYTSLAKRLSWDYSDANGVFGPSGMDVVPPASHEVKINIASAGPVTVDIYDMVGKKAASAYSGVLHRGAYVLTPNASRLSQGLYFLKITAANGVSCHSFVNIGKTRCSAALYSNAPLVLAKRLAAVDTIRVGKTGFAPVKIPIDSYTANVGNVLLSPIEIENQMSTLFSSLGQAEKVGQLIQVDCPDPAAVTNSLLGTFFGGGTDGPGGGAGQPSEWATFSNERQNATLITAKKIPLLIGFDVVHGFAKCKGATVMPHNIGLGCTFDPKIVQKCHRVGAMEARGCGVNFVFGPCIAVPRDDRWGRVYEGFSESPDLTKEMATTAVMGFQTSDLSHPYAVAACTKHFAGDGGTVGGQDRGNAQGDEATLRSIHLPGYTAAIKAGTASVMASFSSWNGIRMHENKALLTDWLKTDQGFDGFINGDWSGDITGTQGTASCIIAGLDVPMRGEGVSGISALQNTFNTLYTNGNSARVDDAVKRLLRIKYRMGLLSSTVTVNPALTALVGCQAHRDIAREAVRKSLVLLKTTPGALPLSATAKVTLVGQHAQDIGLQCGGWTLGWQGAAGNAMPGTTIRQGFEAIGGAGNISFSNDGNQITGDVAVVCIGEQPYAEWVGDKQDLSIPGASCVTNAKNTGKKVICVLITGRPMDISAIIDKCDAVVAAWLPGTEGGGIAEVLYGNYDFTGKLSISWPKSSAQEPINVGDATYQPLYSYDYGLNLAGQQLPKGLYQ
jgi:beta-glucosidase